MTSQTIPCLKGVRHILNSGLSSKLTYYNFSPEMRLRIVPDTLKDTRPFKILRLFRIFN